MYLLIFSLLSCFGFIKTENVSSVETPAVPSGTWSPAHTIWKVATIEMMPFTHLDENGKFQGFIPDLLQHIFEPYPQLSFEFYMVDKYGKKLENGTWVGLIGEIVNSKAHIAAGPLTITTSRSNVVTFSFPFMPSNIVPIMKRPSKHGAKLPFRTIEEMTEMAGKGKLTYGTLKGGSTESMLKNSKYALYSGIYKQMEQMEKDGHHPFVETSYLDAIERIKNDSRYVFLGEDVSLDFLAGRKPCDLLVWGRKPLNTAFYGLAFPKNTSNEELNFINTRIIELQRSGTMKMLKDKWWESQCDFKKPKLCLCHDPDDEVNHRRHHPHHHHNHTKSGEESEESIEHLPVPQ